MAATGRDGGAGAIGAINRAFGALWLELLDYIVSSEIESFLYAFALIGAMMCFIFRSFRTGLLSMNFSVLDASAQSGVLLAATIATALLADLLLTPALVLTLEPFGPEGVRHAELREAA